MALDTQAAQPIDELHGGRFGDEAIGVAHDRDFFGAFDRTSHRQRAHGAAHRAGNDVAGVAEPDELFFGEAQHRRQQRIQPWIDAG